MLLAIPLLLLLAGFILAFAMIMVLLAAFLIATGSMLAFLGVISVSTWIGFCKRKPTAAVKAFVLQTGGLIGAVDGLIAMLLLSVMGDYAFDPAALLAGSSAGLLLGLLVGLLVIRAAQKFKGIAELKFS
jgi:hypothetical protein